MSEDNKKQVTLKGTQEVFGLPKKKYFSFVMDFFGLCKRLGFDEMRFGMFQKDLYVGMTEEDKKKIIEGLWLICGVEKGVSVCKKNIDRDLIGEHGASIGTVHNTRLFKSINLSVYYEGK